MRFITSIFMLLTAVSGVVSAYFIGHFLIVKETWPILTAAALIVSSVVFGFIYLRLAKGDPQPVAHAHGPDAHGHAAHEHGAHDHGSEPYGHDKHGHF